MISNLSRLKNHPFKSTAVACFFCFRACSLVVSPNKQRNSRCFCSSSAFFALLLFRMTEDESISSSSIVCELKTLTFCLSYSCKVKQQVTVNFSRFTCRSFPFIRVNRKELVKVVEPTHTHTQVVTYISHSLLQSSSLITRSNKGKVSFPPPIEWNKQATPK